MAEASTMEELLAIHRKEKKELTAKTQKMKHGVPKGDKRKKKEVTAEIAQMLSDLELKQETEIDEFEAQAFCAACAAEAAVAEEEAAKEAAAKAAAAKEVEAKEAAAEACTAEAAAAAAAAEASGPKASGPKASGPKENLIQSAASGSENGKTKEAECVNTVKEKAEQECTKKKGSQRMSKAQKRRNKKALAAKERTKAIADQELENLSGLRNSESEEIKQKLLERHLTIHEVPSDGNCLYKAIEHQLSSLNLKQITAQSLRERTSEYMLCHMEDYLPFITCPETGDVLTEDQYKKYCEDIATTSAWGGHIEIQALSHVCEMPIEVIQAKGPSVMAGNEDSEPKLILSYHRHVYGLGEHYNSVVPVADD